MASLQPRLTLRLASVLAALALLVLGIAGCGSKKADSSSSSASGTSPTTPFNGSGKVSSTTTAVGSTNIASPKAAFLGYVDSAAAKDWIAVCARMSPTMQRAVVGQIAGVQASKNPPTGLTKTPIKTCPAAASVLLSVVGNGWGVFRKFADTAKVTVHGDHATLTGGNTTIYATKAGGHWLLDQPPATTGSAPTTSAN